MVEHNSGNAVRKFSIPVDRLDVVRKMIKQINDKFGESDLLSDDSERISFEMLATYENPDDDNRLYADVEAKGFLRFGGVEFVGTRSFLVDSETDILIGDSSRGKMGVLLASQDVDIDSDSVLAMDSRHSYQIANRKVDRESKLHGLGVCDCCGVSRKRNETYLFRVLKDVNISTDVTKEGLSFKKGDLCQVGSACVNKFVGFDVRSLLHNFVTLDDKESVKKRVKNPTLFIDPEEFLYYAMAVGRTHIDDFMMKSVVDSKSGGKQHESMDSFVQDYRSSFDVYRKFYDCSSDILGKRSSLTSTALCLYMRDKFGVEDKKWLNVGRSSLNRFGASLGEMLDAGCEATGFYKCLDKFRRNPESQRVVANVSKASLNDDIGNKSVDVWNRDVISSARLMKPNFAEYLVEQADNQFLSMGFAFMHSSDTPVYTVTSDGRFSNLLLVGSNRNGKGTIKPTLPAVKNGKVMDRDIASRLFYGEVFKKEVFGFNKGPSTHYGFQYKSYRDLVRKNEELEASGSRMRYSLGPGLRLDFLTPKPVDGVFKGKVRIPLVNTIVLPETKKHAELRAVSMKNKLGDYVVQPLDVEDSSVDRSSVNGLVMGRVHGTGERSLPDVAERVFDSFEYSGK